MSEIIGSLYEDICNARSKVSVLYHPVMSAELLKSALEGAGRLKVFSTEVPSVSALSLIPANKEIFSVAAWKEAFQGNPKSGY